MYIYNIYIYRLYIYILYIYVYILYIYIIYICIYIIYIYIYASECQNEWKQHSIKEGQAAPSPCLLSSMLSWNGLESRSCPERTGSNHYNCSPRPYQYWESEVPGSGEFALPWDMPKKNSNGKISMPPGRLTKWWKIPDC
jgi:hypothetical protein